MCLEGALRMNTGDLVKMKDWRNRGRTIRDYGIILETFQGEPADGLPNYMMVLWQDGQESIEYSDTVRLFAKANK